MKAHRTDLLSFAFGLVFLGLSAWWLLAQLLGLALPPVGWFLAGALILIGIFGLVGALRSGSSSRPEPNDSTGPGATASATTVAPGAVATEQGPPPTVAYEPPTYEQPTYEPMPDAAPTAELRTPEPPTAELRTPDAPAAGMVHPAWLAHAPAEPESTPATEATRVNHPVTPDGENRLGDPPREESAADKNPVVHDDHPAADDPAGTDERPGRRQDS
ncbi:hypothetical protein ACN263_25840 [Micromonospora sp. WMMD729]|uniref:hypothetical protein n=1 Tax=Micromonospora sp. WMMD729 TaxID=3404127 RepID=UPI003BF574DA